MAASFKYTWKGDQVTAELRQRASRGVLRAAHIVEAEMITLILRTQKSGRVYGNHQASAPGEPFASDSGRTVQGIHVKHQHGALRATVIASGENARRMELGTKRMKRRPFFLRAFMNKRKDMRAAIANAIKRG